MAVAVLGILSIVHFALRDKVKGKKNLKLTGISFAALIVSCILFIATAGSVPKTEIASQVQDDENVSESKTKTETETEPELTEEDKAELEKKKLEDKAELEKKKQEEKAAAELIAKEQAEAKAKAEAEEIAKKEAEFKAELERISKEEAEKKANAQSIPFAQLKKNPDRYAGEYVKYTGEIVQILEGNGLTNIRLSVTKESYGYSLSDIIFIEYLGYTDFVDEDIVTIYGTVYGAYTYQSQAGFDISLPGIIADEIVTP